MKTLESISLSRLTKIIRVLKVVQDALLLECIQTILLLLIISRQMVGDQDFIFFGGEKMTICF